MVVKGLLDGENRRFHEPLAGSGGEAASALRRNAAAAVLKKNG